METFAAHKIISCLCLLFIPVVLKRRGIAKRCDRVTELQAKGSDYFPTHAYMQNALNKRHTE